MWNIIYSIYKEGGQFNSLEWDLSFLNHFSIYYIQTDSDKMSLQSIRH